MLVRLGPLAALLALVALAPAGAADLSSAPRPHQTPAPAAPYYPAPNAFVRQDVIREVPVVVMPRLHICEHCGPCTTARCSGRTRVKRLRVRERYWGRAYVPCGAPRCQ